ncbi:NAD(P)-dependent oxidoreductase [Reinekea blandensis]|nr:NAD(P)-dependent oxidoreductase [Reinekea blandensis]
MNSITAVPNTPSENALDELFKDINPALTSRQASFEASRCYYCYDAPCVKACPSDIDIPSFIASIHNEDLEGAAKTIYSENILGGSCARVCPTEILCEQACVRNDEAECAPVLIGLLQRHATDQAEFSEHPISRAPTTGKRIAVIGGGPAGLSCAHRLASLGHEVDVFEAQSKAGGLNEYGIAKYKLTQNFAQKEVDFILGIGGITLHTNKALGQDIHLEDLSEKYDSVFLGIGLQGTRQLNLDGEDHPAVHNAVDFIKALRQAKHTEDLSVPKKHAIVIGAGNTAIDIACQLKRLGTEEVTLVYRRGTEQMSATGHEQQIAKDHEVRIKTWSRPDALTFDDNNTLTSMTFVKTTLVDGKLTDTEETFTLPCEAVFKAVGQTLVTPENEPGLPQVTSGKFQVDASFLSSLANVYVGGDCTTVGEDLTVEAVQQGKKAALAIHTALMSEEK